MTMDVLTTMQIPGRSELARLVEACLAAVCLALSSDHVPVPVPYGMARYHGSPAEFRDIPPRRPRACAAAPAA